MTRYLIIGAGAAGISAAEAIRSLDIHSDILLVCEEADGYYSRPGLAYLLSGEIPEEQLFPFQERDYQRLKLHRIHAHVKNILPQEQMVELNN